MKALYLNIESSEDVKLAVEMIKNLELDSKEVKTISSPVEELSQAVDTVAPETVVKANTEHENALKEQARVLAEQEAKAKQEKAAAEVARLEKLAEEKAAAEQARLAAEAEAKAVAKAKADKEEAEAKAARAKAREAAKEAKALADAAAAEAAANAEAEAAKEAEAAANAEAEAAKEADKAAKEARFEDRRTADPDSGVSFEMIRIKATNRARRGDLTRERMAEILAKFNARSLTQVKKSDYGQLYADLD
ncbi:hypothetical protein BM127P2_00032 [Phocaeicola phage BM127P2]|nr:hypothetical protein BM127P1_00017 [Phocaeicola phage BM127P1]WAX08311.1 hypothetical protein BM127P2_00032 [Phocaeicola phage BM127P2]WAX08336.1 hypothetical protein BM127P3_00010 [Phocaeicola phage BM127P3]WAX08405.1 hypothetical protein BM127P4_00032 [Phocaeicola phage BM127P4]